MFFKPHKISSYNKLRFSYLRDFVRIYCSGLFSAQDYTHENPDIIRFPKLLHWVLFGRFEGRTMNRSPMVAWLLPSLMDNQISPAQVRSLVKIKKNSSALNARAKALEININDYHYYVAMGHEHYQKAYALLNHSPHIVSPSVAFNGIYEFASRHMKMENLASLDKQHISSHKLTLDQAIIAKNIAKAIGESAQPTADRILKCLSEIPRSLRMETQIFTAHLPVIETGSEICQTLKNLGLFAATKDHDGNVGIFANEVGDFAELINIATYNAVSAEPYFLKDSSAISAQSCLKDARTPKIKIRVLSPHYWVPPQIQHRVTGPVIKLHKQLIAQYIKDGYVIYPIIAGPIFDITDEENLGLDTLSYHTIIRHEKPEKYFHYKEAYLPGYFSWDKFGYSGWSSLGVTPANDVDVNVDIVTEFRKTLYNEFVVNQVSKYTQEPSEGGFIDDTRPYLFAALQVPDDTVAFWRHMPTLEWLMCLSQFAQKNDVQLIVKPHPMDKSLATKRLLSQLEKMANVHIKHANIHDLIKGCTALITTNSGVGFEALLHHKPVITCGRSDYNEATIEVRDTKELGIALRDILSKKYSVDVMKVDMFIYSYCHNHCLMISKL